MDKVVDELVKNIESQDYHIDTGILGAKYLFNALANNGRIDVAYRMATQTTAPSYGNWIEQGATTLWEDWPGASSLNHIMFGDISAWFYKYLAGIQLDPDAPGLCTLPDPAAAGGRPEVGQGPHRHRPRADRIELEDRRGQVHPECHRAGQHHRDGLHPHKQSADAFRNPARPSVGPPASAKSDRPRACWSSMRPAGSTNLRPRRRNESEKTI